MPLKKKLHTDIIPESKIQESNFLNHLIINKTEVINKMITVEKFNKFFRRRQANACHKNA